MVERDDKYEEKYYLFKVEDMDAALKMLNGRKSLCNGDPQKAFAEFCLAYDEYRRVHLGKGVNRYIVFNEDEPYAQFLYDFIVGNKDWKQFLPEEWAKLERQLREKQCEITQLRNDLQLAWNKIEDLTTRNEILESIHRQCPLTKPKSCTCRSNSQNSTGSSSKL